MNRKEFITVPEALDAVDNFHADHRRENAEIEDRDTMKNLKLGLKNAVQAI